MASTRAAPPFLRLSQAFAAGLVCASLSVLAVHGAECLYSVRNGDTAQLIAANQGCAPADVMGANPGVDFQALEPGRALILPEMCSCPERLGCTLSAGPGVSVYDAALARGCYVTDIAAANPGLDLNTVPDGSEIVLPVDKCRCSADIVGCSYVVEEQDSLSEVAVTLGCASSMIQDHNPGLMPGFLVRGQKIVIPPSCECPSEGGATAAPPFLPLPAAAPMPAPPPSANTTQQIQQPRAVQPSSDADTDWALIASGIAVAVAVAVAVVLVVFLIRYKRAGSDSEDTHRHGSQSLDENGVHAITSTTTTGPRARRTNNNFGSASVRSSIQGTRTYGPPPRPHSVRCRSPRPSPPQSGTPQSGTPVTGPSDYVDMSWVTTQGTRTHDSATARNLPTMQTMQARSLAPSISPSGTPVSTPGPYIDMTRVAQDSRTFGAPLMAQPPQSVQTRSPVPSLSPTGTPVSSPGQYGEMTWVPQTTRVVNESTGNQTHSPHLSLSPSGTPGSGSSPGQYVEMSWVTDEPKTSSGSVVTRDHGGAWAEQQYVTMSSRTATLPTAALVYGPRVPGASYRDEIEYLQDVLNYLNHTGCLLLSRWAVLSINERRIGGQGVVQFVWDTETERNHVIKFFLNEAVYQREAQLYGRPNVREMMAAVVHMQNAGVLTPSGDKLPSFIVLKRGSSLDDWAKKRQPDFATSLQVLMQIVGRLKALHAAGYVHRDLKPANILWRTEDNDWTIIDFGCVADLNESNMAEVACSLPYAPPEVAMAIEAGKTAIEVDPASDIWSLGIVVYELLTRERVFPKGCLRSTVLAQLAGRMPLPWEQGAPEERRKRVRRLGVLKRSVMSCLSRTPANRPTAETLLLAINSKFQQTQSRTR